MTIQESASVTVTETTSSPSAWRPAPAANYFGAPCVVFAPETGDESVAPTTGTTGEAAPTGTTRASLDAGAAPAGTETGTAPPVETSAAAPTGTAAEASPDWTTVLSEGTREKVTAKGYKSAADLADAYVALESKIGGALTVPAADADQATWDAFHAKAGRPETANAYEFKLPEGIPEGTPYDTNFAEAAKVAFHVAGLNPRQAQAVHDWYVQNSSTLNTEAVAAYEATFDKAGDEIAKAWGGEKSPTYQRKMQLATRAVDNLGGPELREEMKALGLMNDRNQVRAPKLIDALAKAGEQFGEDKKWSGPSKSEDNPFTKENRNKPGMQTRSDKIILDAQKGGESEKVYARSLITSAGKQPADYGL